MTDPKRNESNKNARGNSSGSDEVPGEPPSLSSHHGRPKSPRPFAPSDPPQVDADGAKKASPAPERAPAIIRSLTRVRAEIGKGKSVFNIDGQIVIINRAEAEFLIAIAEPVPDEMKPPREKRLHHDLLCDWKTKPYLMAKLCITEGCFETRLRRLRRVFHRYFGEDKILKDRKRNGRFRLALLR